MSKLPSSRTAHQQQARALREADGGPMQVLGFESDDGTTKPVPGRDYPQFEVPKQVDSLQIYRRATFVGTEANPANPLEPISFVIGSLARGDVLSSIDVRDARFITFFLRYYPGTSETENAVSTLCIIPEVTPPIPQDGRSQETGLTDTLFWYPIGVVDPVVRGYQPVVDGYNSVGPTWVAYRNCYATQLNFNALCTTNPTTAGVAPQLTLPFDVAQYAELRLRVGVTNIDPDGDALPPKYTYVLPDDANVQIYYLISR